jgi:hypothetical protein
METSCLLDPLYKGEVFHFFVPVIQKSASETTYCPLLQISCTSIASSGQTAKQDSHPVHSAALHTRTSSSVSSRTNFGQIRQHALHPVHLSSLMTGKNIFLHLARAIMISDSLISI